MSQKKTPPAKELEVNSTGLAGVLGISVRRVQQLTQDGVLVTKDKGKFLLGDAVQRYIQSITKNIDENSAKLENGRRAADLKLKAAKAEVAMLEAEELKGKMHRSEDVEVITEDLVFAVRGALIALPGRLAVDCAAAQTAPEAAEVIRKEVYKVMTELASYRYDPVKYEERVRERHALSALEYDDDE